VAQHILYVISDESLTRLDDRALQSLIKREAERSQRGELLVVSAGNAVETVQECLAKDRRIRPRIAAVCLLGSPQDLPMVRWPDLSGADPHLLTDIPYGRTNPFAVANLAVEDFLPEVPVCRIPATDLSLIGRLLKDPKLVDSWDSGIAVYAAAWSDASENVWSTIAGGSSAQAHETPPVDSNEVGDLMAESPPGRVYFNVHGSNDEPVWVGDPGNPVALRPEFIEVASRAVVVSEACYGAHVFDDEPSISLGFLESGANAFVGSSIIAWGPCPGDGEVACADLIVIEFYKAIDEGLPNAQALLTAKQRIREQMTEEDGEILGPAEVNTLASFSLFGAPMARTGKGSSTGSIGGGVGTANRPGSVLDRVSSGSGVLNRLAEQMDHRAHAAEVHLDSLASAVALRACMGRFFGTVPERVRHVRLSKGAQSRELVYAQETTQQGKKCLCMEVMPSGDVQPRAMSKNGTLFETEAM
jgi:hypothetical protein